MKNLLVKGLVVTAISGTIIVASVFNGEGTLNQAKNDINNLGNTLVQFKENEGKLASAINVLKMNKAELIAEINRLTEANVTDKAMITQLNTKIAELETEIKRLEQIIAEGGASDSELQKENDRLTNELVKANLEIEKANKLVADLKIELDKVNEIHDNNKPLTDAEINDLITDTTTPPVPPVDPPTDPTDPPVPPVPPTQEYDYFIDISTDFYAFDDLSIMISNGEWMFEGTAQYPVIIHFLDGTTLNIEANSIQVFNKAIDKITYKTANGTAKSIKVIR